MSSTSSPNCSLLGAGDEVTNIILNHVVEVFPRTTHMQQLLAKKMEEERQQRAEEEAHRLLQMKEEMEKRQKDEEFRKLKQQRKKLRDIEDKKRREEEMKNRDDDSLSQLLKMCVNNETPEEISFSGLGFKEVQLRVLVRDGLARNHTVVALDLRRAGLTDDTGPSIAHMLHTNNCLRKLCLEGNHLGLASAKAFRRALEVNDTLRSLNVENCNFTCRGDEQAGIVELAKGLRVNKGLLNLNLRSNQIDDEGGDALLEAVANNTTLIQLDVSSNDLCEEQVEALKPA